jgi:hypothetical protein
MALATLSGVPIFSGKLTIPFAGLWHADASLTVAQDISGPQTLLLAGVSWTCSVIRAIDFASTRMLRLVAGAGGWRSTIAYKQYGQGSVPTTIVLQDAAAAATPSELAPVIDPSVPGYVGQAWDRGSGPASDVLRQVLGDAWWADASGRVQTAPRSAAAITSAFQAIAVDGAPGIYEITTDAPGDWMPGLTFSGPTVSGTISRVEHTFKGPDLRTTVMVSP